MRQPESITALRKDIKADEKVLRVKKRIVQILARLPDDDSRRRVIVAVGVLTGDLDPLMMSWRRLA